MRIPIVLDTDPGVDDFFCLAVVCAYDRVIDLRAVTAMGGNHSEEITTRNALDILSLLGKNVPVAKGSSSYLKEAYGEPVFDHHGRNGIGDVVIPRSGGKADYLAAWDRLYEAACGADGGLVLLTVAPLTNIARALIKYPDLPGKIRKVVMMGGTLGKGNVTPYAEANVGHDPYAAEILFESGIPVDMVGLDITMTCPMPRDVFDPMAAETREDVRSALQGLIDFRRGEPMHDAVAAASLIDPDMLTWKTGSLKVITDDAEHLGQTVFEEQADGRFRVACGVDLSRYYKVIGGMLEAYRA